MCDLEESLAYPIDPAFRLLGRRWASEVLLQIIGGTVRYSQLLRALHGISPRTLSARVAELEQVGIISKIRKNHTECVYELTEKGVEMRRILDSVAAFSIQWHAEMSHDPTLWQPS